MTPQTRPGPFAGVVVDIAELPKAGAAFRRATSWGSRYVRFRVGEGGRIVWTDLYDPWETRGEFIKAIRRLGSASESEVAASYRRYGPLGYPEWAQIGGEPLGWVRWEALKLETFARLEHAFRNDQPSSVRQLIAQGVSADGSIMLPDAIPGALEIPRIFGQSGGEPPSSDGEVMRAARFCIQIALREALKGVAIIPSDDWRPYRESKGGRIRIKGSLAWSVPTLIQAAYLQFYLGHISETPIRFCEVCGTPYLPRGSSPTCSQQCTDALRQRRRRGRLRAKQSPTT